MSVSAAASSTPLGPMKAPTAAIAHVAGTRATHEKCGKKQTETDGQSGYCGEQTRDATCETLKNQSPHDCGDGDRVGYLPRPCVDDCDDDHEYRH